MTRWGGGDERTRSADPERDRELIARTVQGDAAAFAQLMAAHEDLVFSVCLRFMRDREAALDAAQETFLTLYRKADRYRGEAAVTTWLYRIAVNTCLDLLRRSKRRQTDPLPEHHDPADPGWGDPFESVELRPSIEGALAALPDEFRAAVILSDLEGLPLAEISRVLDVPVGTVKSRIHRGRRLLAGSLGNLREASRHPSEDEHA